MKLLREEQFGKGDSERLNHRPEPALSPAPNPVCGPKEKSTEVVWALVAHQNNCRLADRLWSETPLKAPSKHRGAQTQKEHENLLQMRVKLWGGCTANALRMSLSHHAHHGFINEVEHAQWHFCTPTEAAMQTGQAGLIALCSNFSFAKRRRNRHSPKTSIRSQRFGLLCRKISDSCITHSCSILGVCS